MGVYVYCTFEVEGFHKWDGAKEIEEVKYLADKHRHIFHYKVGISVTHDDREIEFIMLKHILLSEVTSWDKNDMGSCEAQAIRIIDYLKVAYPNRKYYVECSEDGENGAYVEHDGRR